MPLDKQVVGVNFTKGLDTRDDPRLLLPGYMVTLDNATTSKTGTIVRRDGNATLAALSSGAGVATFNNELLALAANALSSYSPNASALESRGTVSLATLTVQDVTRNTTAQDQFDCATASGLTCYVWRDTTAGFASTNGARVTIRDETSGAVVLAETYLKAGTIAYPRVIAAGGAFFCLYEDTAGSVIYCRVIAVTAPSTLGAEVAVTSEASLGVFDACAVGSSAAVVYARGTAVGADPSVRVLRVDRTGTVPSVGAGPTTITTHAQIASAVLSTVTIAAFSTTSMGVGILTTSGAGTPGLWTGVVSNAMAVTSAAAQKDNAAGVLTGGGSLVAALNGATLFFFADQNGSDGAAASVVNIRRTGIDSSNAVTSAATTYVNSYTRANGTNGPWIAGKPLVVGSTTYLPTWIAEYGTGSLQGTWLLLDGSARIAARALYGAAGPSLNRASWGTPAPASPAASVFILPASKRGLLSFAGGTNVTTAGMARIRLDFSQTAPCRAQLGQSLAFALAAPTIYDGVAPTEAVFPLFPEVVSAAQGAAGGVVTTGAHLLVALYEWIDGAGQRHQSAPSVAITYTAADSTHHCTVTIPTLPLSSKTGVTIGVYASAAGGATLYRLNAANAPLANDTTVATVTYDFNAADATLIGGELLYTTGGILPNNAPPPCSVCWTHQNRLWTDVGDDQGAFRFSQPAVSGFGLQFNETLGGRIPETITGGVSMDDKSIIFSARQIYVVYGTGPGTTGANNGYSAPIPLATDVGCAEPRSILLMPTGVLFKSLKGWYLLGRDLQVRYVGIGAEAYNGQGVTSAVLLADRQEARFTTNDANGKMLVFSYVSEDWSTSSSQVSADAVWWSGGAAYVRMTSAGLVQDLPPTTAAHALGAGYTYGDGATTITGGAGTPYPQTGSAIPLTFRTGWLKPGDALEAFQRIWWVVLTGVAAGMPPVATGTTTGATPGPPTNINNAGATTLRVVSTAGFPAAGTVIAEFGAANYEAVAYASITSTDFALSTPLVFTHADGSAVRSATTSVGAAGSLTIDFYVDGNDTTSVQTISIADVSGLTAGDVWHLRVQPVIQKCSAMQLQVVSTPAATDPGASLNFSGMTLELGVKKGARKLQAAQTK